MRPVSTPVPPRATKSTCTLPSLPTTMPVFTCPGAPFSNTPVLSCQVPAATGSKA
jgi:hypothetical protein